MMVSGPIRGIQCHNAKPFNEIPQLMVSQLIGYGQTGKQFISGIHDGD